MDDKRSDDKPEYLELPHPVFICFAEHDRQPETKEGLLARLTTRLKRLLPGRGK